MSDEAEQQVRGMYERMQKLRNDDGELLFPHLNEATLLAMGEMLRNPPADFFVLRATIGINPDVPELFQLLRDAYWYVVHHRHPALN